MTEQTQQAIDDYIKAAGKKPGEYLFSGLAVTTAVHNHPAICSARLDVGGND